MNNPTPTQRWTATNRDVDLSGFTTPTTDTTPWGEPGSIVRFDLTVAMTQAPPALNRSVVEGVWAKETHGLKTVVRTRKGRPPEHGNVGLCGLVRLYVNKTEKSANHSFTVSGQCLIADEARMRSLVLAIAGREIDALLAHLQASRNALAEIA